MTRYEFDICIGIFFGLRFPQNIKMIFIFIFIGHILEYLHVRDRVLLLLDVSISVQMILLFPDSIETILVQYSKLIYILWQCKE